MIVAEDERYRCLIAAVLHCALDDCLTGKTEASLAAYRWMVLDYSPEFRAYCELIDINPERFRREVIEKTKSSSMNRMLRR